MTRMSEGPRARAFSELFAHHHPDCCGHPLPLSMQHVVLACVTGENNRKCCTANNQPLTTTKTTTISRGAVNLHSQRPCKKGNVTRGTICLVLLLANAGVASATNNLPHAVLRFSLLRLFIFVGIRFFYFVFQLLVVLATFKRQQLQK